ncbi:MAG: diguanylate cyclase [Planctomycetes bacterium]|nr:diguanylate cyclase [Planctomycetota bacterium]
MAEKTAVLDGGAAEHRPGGKAAPIEEDVVDVCVIEDDPAQRALLLQRLLRQQYSVVQAEDGRAGLEQIRRHRPRVVICDLMMPELDGLTLCKTVRSDPALDGTYLVVVTAFGSRDCKNRALNAGADDYLIKPYDIEELTARLRNGLRFSRLQERLQRAALTDGLTGLWNHGQLRHLLDNEFARTRRYGGVISLLMIDLDHFKAINDTYGHEMGNRVLKATARHLAHTVRDIDTVARYGGEEFTVICPQTSLEEAVQLAERIRQTLPHHARVPEHPHLIVNASLGVVSTTDPRVTSVSDLINLADQALYAAKRQGRNQVVGSDHLTDGPPEVGVQVEDVDRLQKQVVKLSMQAKELCLQSVWALVQALEARDRYTACHSRNVTFYCNALAEAAGWPESLRVAGANAAMLHDLGKIGVPDQILQKPGRLTPQEATVLRQVPLMTCKILEPLRIFGTEILIIRHLRERYDGAGYPDGLAGTNIPIGARLLAVAEAFDALTSDRVHRAHCTIDAAVAEIRSDASQHFDPQFTELLARVIEEHQDAWQAQIDRSHAELQTAPANAK